LLENKKEMKLLCDLIYLHLYDNIYEVRNASAFSMAIIFKEYENKNNLAAFLEEYDIFTEFSDIFSILSDSKDNLSIKFKQKQEMIKEYMVIHNYIIF
jgi:hypothetical protein